MSQAKPPTFDSTRWHHRMATITTSRNETLRLNYIDCASPSSDKTKGVILLIHGFPQTSYQFRHVITPISDAGYRVIAPDYRGAGQSSKPIDGYTKFQMAEDLHILLQDHLGWKHKVHVVGHDIGGMIAFAYAAQYEKDTASVIWGECPLPGTNFYEDIKSTVDVFHFIFHQIQDLPEALTAGRERLYLQHFYDKLCLNSAFLTQDDLEQYVLAFSQPGAMRAGFELYRAFEKDAEENRAFLKEKGKVGVRSLGLAGAGSFLASKSESMLKEVHSEVEVSMVADAGHYIAEENPEGFVKAVLGFVEKQST
jgi:pimeloyl-ACP methyl ester carboxylesterase